MLREYYKCEGAGHAMEKDCGQRDRPLDFLGGFADFSRLVLKCPFPSLVPKLCLGTTAWWFPSRAWELARGRLGN
jgi:hypothetical protein